MNRGTPCFGKKNAAFFNEAAGREIKAGNLLFLPYIIIDTFYSDILMKAKRGICYGTEGS